MHIGLLSLGDLVTDPTTGQRRTHAERHRNLVDQAVTRCEQVAAAAAAAAAAREAPGRAAEP